MVGQRVRWYDNFGRKPNGTVMAACNSDGFVRRACELIMEPMDTERFIQWVDEGLVQARVLGNYVRGERNSVVMLDNVAQHHNPRVRELIEGAGAELIFLPRYRFHFFAPSVFDAMLVSHANHGGTSTYVLMSAGNNSTALICLRLSSGSASSSVICNGRT